MDVYIIKNMIVEMMKREGLSPLGAEIKAKAIIETACDIIEEDYENGDLQ